MCPNVAISFIAFIGRCSLESTVACLFRERIDWFYFKGISFHVIGGPSIISTNKYTPASYEGFRVYFRLILRIYRYCFVYIFITFPLSHTKQIWESYSWLLSELHMFRTVCTEMHWQTSLSNYFTTPLRI